MEQQTKRKHGLIAETSNDIFKFGFYSTIKVCTMGRFFSEHIFIIISLRNCNKKMKKNGKFLDLRGLSTESFLAIWLSHLKLLINEFLIKNWKAQLDARVCFSLSVSGPVYMSRAGPLRRDDVQPGFI